MSSKRRLRYRFRWWHLHVSLGMAALVALFFLIVVGGSNLRVFKVGGPHGTGQVTLTVPAAAASQAAAGIADHKNSRDETPPGAPASAINAAQHQDAALAASDQLPTVFPDAAPEQRGCRTELVQDYSSRNGVAPRAFILHYTVSANRPGWADVNAIIGIFNTWSYQASSNYVLDGEGHCAYIVRETDKAWTQAAANPVSISVEVIATGQEQQYIAKAGLSKLVVIISDACYRWKIPVQLGAFTNGVLTRPGILDHRMLGVAGGGHYDIDRIVNGKFNDVSGLARTVQVIAAVKAYRATHPLKPHHPALTAAQKRALARAVARKGVLELRLQGETWAQVKTTPIYKQFHDLGGH